MDISGINVISIRAVTMTKIKGIIDRDIRSNETPEI